jgi:hypothetical protein
MLKDPRGHAAGIFFSAKICAAADLVNVAFAD